MTFEEWWASQNIEEMSDGTWANVSKIKEIAGSSWGAGFEAATKAAYEMLDKDTFPKEE
jgi:hypothetical protein